MTKRTLKELRDNMTMKEIVAFALEWGVKVNKKGSKASAIGKIEAYCPEAILHEVKAVDVEETPVNEETPVIEVATETEETPVPVKEEEAPAPVKNKKKSKKSKKTFEELVAEIPAVAGIRFVRARNNDVLVKRGKKRVFRYNGHTLIATNEKMLNGCNYEKQNWNGYVVHNATYDDMKTALSNA